MEKLTKTELLNTAETVARDFDELVDAALGQNDLYKAMDQAFKVKLSSDRLCTDARWVDTDTVDNYHVYRYLAGRIASQACVVLSALYEVEDTGRDMQSVFDLHNAMNVLEAYIGNLREEMTQADAEGGAE